MMLLLDFAGESRLTGRLKVCRSTLLILSKCKLQESMGHQDGCKKLGKLPMRHWPQGVSQMCFQANHFLCILLIYSLPFVEICSEIKHKQHGLSIRKKHSELVQQLQIKNIRRSVQETYLRCLEGMFQMKNVWHFQGTCIKRKKFSCNCCLWFLFSHIYCHI